MVPLSLRKAVPLRELEIFGESFVVGWASGSRVPGDLHSLLLALSLEVEIADFAEGRYFMVTLADRVDLHCFRFFKM